jgi:hypothetical protein
MATLNGHSFKVSKLKIAICDAKISAEPMPVHLRLWTWNALTAATPIRFLRQKDNPSQEASKPSGAELLTALYAINP